MSYVIVICVTGSIAYLWEADVFWTRLQRSTVGGKEGRRLLQGGTFSLVTTGTRVSSVTGCCPGSCIEWSFEAA